MKSQFIGCIFVISLILFIIGLDRLLVLNFQVTGELFLILEMAVSFVVCLLVLCLIKKDENRPDRPPLLNWKEKMIMIVSNTCSGSVLDTLIVLSFIGFAAWIPDSISDFIKDGASPLRPFIYLGGLSIMVWGKPGTYVKNRKVSNDERRLLLTGMSNVSIHPVNGRVNIVPLIKPFGTYSNIDTMVILLSEEILSGVKNLEKSIEHFKENMNGVDADSRHMFSALIEYLDRIKALGLKESDRLKKGDRLVEELKVPLSNLLKVCISGTYPSYQGKDVLIVFSAPVDYNKFEPCNNECFNILNYVMQGGGKNGKYKDENIVVNTTPGTSVVASVMTINAIKGSRAMVYTNQKTFILEPADPDVTLIQFPEWLQDREEQFGNKKYN